MEDTESKSVSHRWLRFPFHFDAPNKHHHTNPASNNNNHTDDNDGHFYANTPQKNNNTITVDETITTNGHLYGNSPTHFSQKKNSSTQTQPKKQTVSSKDRTYSVSTTESEIDAEEQKAKYNEVLEKIQAVTLSASLDLPEHEATEYSLKTKSFSDGNLPLPPKTKETNKKKKKSLFSFNNKKKGDLEKQLDKVNEEIRFDPDNLHLYLKRAQIHGLLGNKEEAKRDYDIIQNPSPSMVNRTNRIQFKSSDEIHIPESIQQELAIEVTPGPRLKGSQSLPPEAFRLRKYE